MNKNNIPSFIYGTAWKKDATTDLVKLALKAGFVAIDTANQLKHYSEELVGQAILGRARTELWLQSKFTSINGQDQRLPYDPKAALKDQVKQSFASSLSHLHSDYLDSYLLHGPYNFPSLGKEDFEVWGAIEEIYISGQAKSIGISNVNLEQLELLCKKAKVKPMMVQNRCYANRNWDRGVRLFCKQNDIHYQGFSLLTANPQVVEHAKVALIAKKYKILPEQIVFRFATQVGIIPLTGTSNIEHMKLDLSINSFELSDLEMDLIGTL